MSRDLSSGNGGIVQTQWTINETIFSSWDLLLKLIQAGTTDDVHAPALLAFEALGSSIIVCDDRTDEGMDALSQYSSVKKWGVTLGLIPGGIPHFIHKQAKRCVPAFLLVTSLKSCCKDEHIGRILFNMLALQGLSRKPELRCSRHQLSNVVSSISGFSDMIVPSHLFEWVLSTLKQSNASRDQMKLALAEPDPDMAAEIYSRIHGSLCDQEVDCISLTGHVAFVSIATSLLWLHENECLMTVGDQARNSPQKAKIVLKWSQQGANDRNWEITTWHQEKMISKFIVTSNQESDARRIAGLVPVKAAKSCIAIKYKLSDSETESVGTLAAAFVVRALEHGATKSISMGRDALPTIKLKSICQPSYLTNSLQSMEPYGWLRLQDRVQKRQLEQQIGELAEAIQKWTANGFSHQEAAFEILDFLPESQAATGRIYATLCGISIWEMLGLKKTSMAVVEAAVHLAGESLRSCICSLFPKNRQFRLGDLQITKNNCRIIEELVFGDFHQQLSEDPSIIPSPLNGGSMIEWLRLQCITSLLPGAELVVPYDAEGGDCLVFSVNGYVGYAASLLDISIHSRDSLAIKICPGHLRWGGESETEPMRFERLSPVEPSDIDKRINNPSDTEKSFEELGRSSTSSMFNPWSTDGSYRGVSLPKDEDELYIDHTWGVAGNGKTLSMRTYMCHPATKARFLVSWNSSIAEIARATHLDDGSLPGFAEEALARDLKKDGIWPTIQWCAASDQVMLHREPIQRVISRTHGNEELQFFLAGRKLCRQLFIHSRDAPLIKSIQTALEHEKEVAHAYHPNWMIIV